MMVGHFMLFGILARHQLMVAAGIRERHRKGTVGSTFKWWCEEAVPVRTAMPKSATVFNGISIVDFADPCRFDMLLTPSGLLSASGAPSDADTPSTEATRRAALADARPVGLSAVADTAAAHVGGSNAAPPAAFGSTNDSDDDADVHLVPLFSGAGAGDDAEEGLGVGNQGRVDCGDTDEGSGGEEDADGDEECGGGDGAVGGEEDDDLGLGGVDLIL